MLYFSTLTLPLGARTGARRGLRSGGRSDLRSARCNGRPARHSATRPPGRRPGGQVGRRRECSLGVRTKYSGAVSELTQLCSALLAVSLVIHRTTYVVTTVSACAYLPTPTDLLRLYLGAYLSIGELGRVRRRSARPPRPDGGVADHERTLECGGALECRGGAPG